jgi:hypothetical protein
MPLEFAANAVTRKFRDKHLVPDAAIKLIWANIFALEMSLLH